MSFFDRSIGAECPAGRNRSETAGRRAGFL